MEVSLRPAGRSRTKGTCYPQVSCLQLKCFIIACGVCDCPSTGNKRPTVACKLQGISFLMTYTMMTQLNFVNLNMSAKIHLVGSEEYTFTCSHSCHVWHTSGPCRWPLFRITHEPIEYRSQLTAHGYHGYHYDASMGFCSRWSSPQTDC